MLISYRLESLGYFDENLDEYPVENSEKILINVLNGF